jgi:hypothetical protein
MSQLPLCGNAITAPRPAACAAAKCSAPMNTRSSRAARTGRSIDGSRKASRQYRA